MTGEETKSVFPDCLQVTSCSSYWNIYTSLRPIRSHFRSQKRSRDSHCSGQKLVSQIKHVKKRSDRCQCHVPVQIFPPYVWYFCYFNEYAHKKCMMVLCKGWIWKKKDLQTNRQLWWDHKYFHVNTPASTGKVVQWYRSLSYPTQQDVEPFLRLVSFTWGNLFHTAEITGRPN